jgi:transcription elongation factor Elf1
MMYKYEVAINCGDCNRTSTRIIAREESSVIFVGCKVCGFWTQMICENGDSWTTRTPSGKKFLAFVEEK